MSTQTPDSSERPREAIWKVIRPIAKKWPSPELEALERLFTAHTEAAVQQASKELLERLRKESRETKDLKTGQILQTVGLGYIFNELASLERQQDGKDGDNG